MFLSTIYARESRSLFLQSQSLQLALWVELILLFLVYPSIEIIDLPSTFVINGLKSDSRLPVYNALDFMLSLRNG